MMQLVSPSLIRADRIIKMDNIVVGDIDSVAKFNAFQAALSSGEGREVVFNAKIGQSRSYRFTQRFGRLIMPKRSRIIMDAGASCDFTDWGTSGTPTAMFYAAGALTPVAVTVNVTAGTRTVTVANGATFVRGMRFVLNTTELYTPMDGSLGVKGEWCIVRSVAGNVITTVTEIRFDYPISGNTVVAHAGTDLVNLQLENFTFTGPGMLDGTDTVGDRGIEVLNADRLTITGGEINDSDAFSIIGNTVRQMLVKEVASVKTQLGIDARTRYGVSVAGAGQIATIEGCSIEGGSELISPTLSGGVLGLKEHIRVTGCMLRGGERSGVATHHGYLIMQVDHCKFYDCNQGVDFRLGGKFNDNIVRNLGGGVGNLNTAVQLGSGFDDFTASDNDIENVLRGYFLPEFAGGHWRVPPGNVSIMNDVMDGVDGFGVLLLYNGTAGGANLDATLGNLNVRADISLGSTGAPMGIQAKGRWDNPDINITVRGGSATARTVFLTRPDASVSATDGPWNPIITTRREAPVLGSLVQFPVNGAPSVTITDSVFGNF
jgi:hypothetical protein